MRKISIQTQGALVSKLKNSLNDAKRLLRNAFTKNDIQNISKAIKYLEIARETAEQLWKNTDGKIWKDKLEEIEDYLSPLKNPSNVKVAINEIKNAKDYGTAVDKLTLVFESRKIAENFIALAMIVDGFINASRRSKK